MLQEAAEKHGDEGVEDRSGEYTDDGAVGSCKATSSLGGILLDNFDEPRREETNGDDWGDELNETQDALEPQVGSGLAEALVCAFDAHNEKWYFDQEFVTPK